MSRSSTIARLVDRALAAAQHLPSGRSYAVLSEACDLPAEPLQHFAEQPVGARSLLWWQSAWMVASGEAETVDANGPGRTLHLAEAAARIRACTVVADCNEQRPPAPVLNLALTFENRAPEAIHWGPNLPGARLRLPQRLWWRRRSGMGWRIDAVAVTADDDPERIAAWFEHPVAQSPPAPGQAWHSADQPDFRQLVSETAALINNGAFRKVVLARTSDHDLPNPPNISDTLARLHGSADPWTYVYANDLADGGIFLGATPELLFHNKGRDLQTVALAGSRSRGDDPAADAALGAELLASTKEQKEHQLVVEHLRRQLKARCTDLSIPGSPALRKLDRLQHLETPIKGTLQHSDPFDLISAVHPTPAVAGLPVESASDYIQRIEGLHRGLYTGTIGYCSTEGARMLVPLRGGIVRHAQARLFAGAGIVETSDPDAEYHETELKLGPMRRALGLRA